MSQPTNTNRALKRFNEAMSRAQLRAKAERHGKRLEAALRRAFKAQASLLVRKLRRVRGKFGEGFEGHARFINSPLRESLGEADWMAIWYEVQQETVKLFSEPLDEAVSQALKQGALASIGQVGMELSFSLDNPRAVQYLENYGVDQIKGLNDTTLKDTLKDIIVQAADEGWSYTRSAQEIMDAFDGMSAYRANLIATTEIGDAYVEGNMIVGRDLQDGGLEMEKFWSTSGSNPCEDICGPNEEAGWIPLDEDFPSGDSQPLGHPGCHCDILIRRKGSED